MGAGPCKHRSVKRTEPRLFAKDLGSYPSSARLTVVFGGRPDIRSPTGACALRVPRDRSLASSTHFQHTMKARAGFEPASGPSVEASGFFELPGSTHCYWVWMRRSLVIA